MENPKIIKTKQPASKEWLYVGPNGKLIRDRERALRLDNNESGRRMLQYLNDYPGWQFQEEDA